MDLPMMTHPACQVPAVNAVLMFERNSCPSIKGLAMEISGADPGIFNGRGAQTLFKEKSGSAWAFTHTHSQVPCLCKNKGGARWRCPPPPLNPPVNMNASLFKHGSGF